MQQYLLVIFFSLAFEDVVGWIVGPMVLTFNTLLTHQEIFAVTITLVDSRKENGCR